MTLRVGPYTDVDYDELIQHHLDHRCPVTMAVDSEGASLDLFVLSACSRKDAVTLFRSRLQQLRRECKPFQVAGYVNRLRHAGDLRRLALDGLLERNSIRPAGREIKPGVWVGESAHIHHQGAGGGSGVRGGSCQDSRGRSADPWSHRGAARGSGLRHGGGKFHGLAFHLRGCRPRL